MNKEILRLERADIGFPGCVLLKDYSVEIRTGELIALVGPNGSGKTTLLKSFLGLHPLLGGSRFLLGRENGQPEDFPGGLSYVPQRMSLNSAIPLSVKEFLSLKGKQAPDSNQIRTVLDRVDLSSFGDASLNQLSGGQLQRVFLAFSLLGDPRLIALDEATEGLDFKSEKAFMELLLKTVKEEDRAAIFISHDISAVTDHATRVICLAGRSTFDGDPRTPEFHSCLHDIYGKNAHIHSHRHTGGHGHG